VNLPVAASNARLKLYSDALGSPDTSAADYAGMIRTNIDNVVNSLKAP
jgi:ABC-type Zn uptake system ZnuABC Zn-binding protein ZnuA